MLIQTENDRVFAAAVAFTRERSPASFDQWFSGVQFDGLTDGVLALRARDEFVREWVDDHFLPTLTDFIRAQTGWSVQVAWIVDSGLDRPVVDQPSAPPVRPRALSLRPSSIPPAPSAPSTMPPSQAPSHVAPSELRRESGVHAVVGAGLPTPHAPFAPGAGYASHGGASNVGVPH